LRFAASLCNRPQHQQEQYPEPSAPQDSTFSA
jgi:hypothetical protein